MFFPVRHAVFSSILVSLSFFRLPGIAFYFEWFCFYFSQCFLLCSWLPFWRIASRLYWLSFFCSSYLVLNHIYLFVFPPWSLFSRCPLLYFFFNTSPPPPPRPPPPSHRLLAWSYLRRFLRSFFFYCLPQPVTLFSDELNSSDGSRRKQINSGYGWFGFLVLAW